MGGDGVKPETVTVRSASGVPETVPLYHDGDTVSGVVTVTPAFGKKVDHQGVKIELLGQIEAYYDKGSFYDFIAAVREVAGPGEIREETKYDFEFPSVEMLNESYSGVNVRLRYVVKVSVIRSYRGSMVKDVPFCVRNTVILPEINNSIKMEVGIEDCLHIEFEYNKSKYHLKDIVTGKIYFLLVRIKIKHMELAIIKRETTGSGPNTFNENETIAKYEIMDGAPVRGETIPIRLFLAGYDLTPTMRDINKKFSVRYYLNLVLVDEEERRYFKQQEITLWRKGERVRKLPLANSLYQQQHALARHDAGDQPTEGVRTAPTPSQPPTPYADSEKPLPGEILQEEVEEQND